MFGLRNKNEEGNEVIATLSILGNKVARIKHNVTSYYLDFNHQEATIYVMCGIQRLTKHQKIKGFSTRGPLSKFSKMSTKFPCHISIVFRNLKLSVSHKLTPTQTIAVSWTKCRTMCIISNNIKSLSMMNLHIVVMAPTMEI